MPLSYEELFKYTEVSADRIEEISNFLLNNENDDEFFNIVKSFKEIYAFIIFSKFEKIDDKCMFRLETVSESEKWLKMEDKEYIYPIMTYVPSIIDTAKYFRENPIDAPLNFTGALCTPEIYADYEKTHKFTQFMSGLQIGELFEENSEEVVNKVREIKDIIDYISPYLLTNVFEGEACREFDTEGATDDQIKVLKDERIVSERIESFKKFTTRRERAEGNYWESDKISEPGREIGLGENVFTDKKTFEKRLLVDFCKNMLTETQNPEMQGVELDYSKYIITGSVVTQLLSPEGTCTKGSDVDIFVVGVDPDDRKKNCENIIRWLTIPGITYFAVCRGVISIYYRDIPLTFQIMSTRHTDGYSVVSRFDLTHIQTFCMIQKKEELDKYINPSENIGFKSHYWGASYGLQVYMTPNAIVNAAERTSYINNTSQIVLLRYIKAMYIGYAIKYEENDENLLNITSFIKNPARPEIQEMIEKIKTIYYPVTNEEPTADDADKNILGMLRKVHPAYETFTMDINTAFNSIQHNLDFDAGYDNCSFKKVDPKRIVFKPGRSERMSVRDKSGVLNIISGKMTVSRITNEGPNVIILANVDDPEFVKFINETVERDFADCYGIEQSKKLLEGNTLKIRFEGDEIDSPRRKSSVAQDNFGVELNIREDISDNDIITVMFSIDINTRVKQLSFNYRKLFKYVDHHGENDNGDMETDEKVSEETVAEMTETEFEESEF